MRIHRSSIAQAVLAAFVAIGLFFMVTEHRAHAFGALPWVLLALCPVLLLLVLWHDGRGAAAGPPPTQRDRGRE